MFSYKLSENTEVRLLEERHAQELTDLTDRNREHLRRLMHNDASKKSSFTENFGSAAKCLRSPSCYFNSGYFNSAPMELAPKLK